MARPQTSRDPGQALDGVMLSDAALVRPVVFAASAEGIDSNSTIEEGDPNVCSVAKNLRINKHKKYEVRRCLRYLGTSPGDYIVDVATVRSAAGSEYILRWTTTGLQYWSGSSWLSFTGPTLTLGTLSNVPWTVFGSYFLFSDPHGIMKVNLELKTYSLIAGSPACYHLSTFGSRVIASHVYTTLADYPTRIQWSVKNNSDDWTGLGSGYEDLLSSPSGVDAQYGVYPVNDTEAIIVRSGSFWKARTTGAVDTPFAFNYLYQVKCDSPHSVASTPAGIFFVGRDNVYLANTSTLQPIGNKVIDSWEFLDLLYIQATYDWNRQEYLIYIPNTNYASPSTVWVYNAMHDAWTTFEYNLPLKTIIAPNSRTSLSIDALTGTIDSLTGSIDNLGHSAPIRGLIAVTYGASARVLLETYSSSVEPQADGSTAAVTAVLRTGRVVPANPLARIRVHEIQLSVESGLFAPYTPQFRYSGDNFTGADTAVYVTGSLVTRTAISRDVRAHKRELDRETLQLELSLTGCPDLVLNYFAPMVDDGAPVRL